MHEAADNVNEEHNTACVRTYHSSLKLPTDEGKDQSYNNYVWLCHYLHKSDISKIAEMIGSNYEPVTVTFPGTQFNVLKLCTVSKQSINRLRQR